MRDNVYVLSRMSLHSVSMFFFMLQPIQKQLRIHTFSSTLGILFWQGWCALGKFPSQFDQAGTVTLVSFPWWQLLQYHQTNVAAVPVWFFQHSAVLVPIIQGRDVFCHLLIRTSLHRHRCSFCTPSNPEIVENSFLRCASASCTAVTRSSVSVAGALFSIACCGWSTFSAYFDKAKTTFIFLNTNYE